MASHDSVSDLTRALTDRGRRERLVEWLYTGPLGHLYGVLADLVQLWVRYGVRRLRLRVSRR
ncbi:MAG TPA: hypothetical protein VF752_16235 [Thermoleophilaceae bacterium]